MVTRSVEVTNALGLHARAAARFVHLATRFASTIRVSRDSKVMDGKSIMGILLLAAAREMREVGRAAIWVASDLLRGEKAAEKP